MQKLYANQLPAQLQQGLAPSYVPLLAGMLVGVLLGLPLGGYDVGYTNSVWGLSPETATRARVQLAVQVLPLVSVVSIVMGGMGRAGWRACGQSSK